MKSEDRVNSEMEELLKEKGFESSDTPTLQQVYDWLYKKGVWIYVSRYYATEEEPFRWVVNKKQEGSWGGSSTYYAPEKEGDAGTQEEALEQAFQWTLNNLI